MHRLSKQSPLPVPFLNMQFNRSFLFFFLFEFFCSPCCLASRLSRFFPSQRENKTLSRRRSSSFFFFSSRPSVSIFVTQIFSQRQTLLLLTSKESPSTLRLDASTTRASAVRRAPNQPETSTHTKIKRRARVCASPPRQVLGTPHLQAPFNSNLLSTGR